MPYVLMVTITLCLALPAPGGELAVVSVTPAPHGASAAVDCSIRLGFDRPLDASSIEGALRVRGRWSGPTIGAVSLADDDHTLVFTPDAPFSAGEIVFVGLSRHLRGADGTSLRDAGYAASFWTRAGRATLEFEPLETLDLRTDPDVPTRIYGGQACDLDRDGWLDLAVINEFTSDVRVLVNSADGTGLIDAFLEPVNPVGNFPSPNEPADFNGDGLVDLCTANMGGASVSILLGNGDGTFQPHVETTIGSAPHGLAVLDVDGDGDEDVAASCVGENRVSVLLNDGLGALGSLTEYESGLQNEYTICAADMNNDGVDDLVVGSRVSEAAAVLLNQGDGTFAAQPVAAAGGEVWMIVPGDVNGDGNVDVTTANAQSNSGSILLGDGAGNLVLDAVYPTGNGVAATDLGDLDGDGDLDWILSGFGGGIWEVFLNDGCGAFTSQEVFPAPANPACCVIFDLDNDRDLDLALLDEVADVVVLMRNTSVPGPPADVDGDGTVGVADLLAVLAAWGPCDDSCLADCDADIDANGAVDVSDLLAVIGAWS